MGALRAWARILTSATAVCAGLAPSACGPPPELRLTDGSGGWNGPSSGVGGGPTWVPDQGVPVCGGDGEACEQDGNCCAGEVCATDEQGDAYCQSPSPGAACQPSGSVCNTDADCCSGACDPTQLVCY